MITTNTELSTLQSGKKIFWRTSGEKENISLYIRKYLTFRLNVGNKVFLTTWKMLSQHQDTKGRTICYPGIDVNNGMGDSRQSDRLEMITYRLVTSTIVGQISGVRDIGGSSLLL